MENFGIVYVLINPCMPNIVKIGMTERNDVTDRIKELSHPSGVPLDFKPLYVCKVPKEKCRSIEHALHVAFSPDRVNQRKEFFRTEPYRIKALLEQFAIEDMTENISEEFRKGQDPYEIDAEQKQEEYSSRTKRPTINYFTLGIKKDEHLYWKDDETKFVTVCSERKVIFEGVECSLTAVTQKLKGITTPIAPSPYWLYNGKPLSEIYADFYTPIDSSEE